MNDLSLPLIVALLPLVAGLLVLQVNPYHALVIRGVLGAIAALVDALLGAADVALTEALVGTLLAMMLYAVAVRSSLVLRLGIIQDESSLVQPFLDQLRSILNQQHLRLESVFYSNTEELEDALINKEIHATCIPSKSTENNTLTYQTQTRIQRIYEILQEKLSSSQVSLSYVPIVDAKEK